MYKSNNRHTKPVTGTENQKYVTGVRIEPTARPSQPRSKQTHSLNVKHNF